MVYTYLIELLVLISALQDAKSLAGGQLLMPIIKKLFIVLEDIVDTNEIDELNYFCQENGHARPPYGHPSLGTWVYRQRKKYKNDKLSKEHFELLKGLKGWSWEGR